MRRFICCCFIFFFFLFFLFYFVLFFINNKSIWKICIKTIFYVYDRTFLFLLLFKKFIFLLDAIENIKLFPRGIFYVQYAKDKWKYSCMEYFNIKTDFMISSKILFTPICMWPYNKISEDIGCLSKCINTEFVCSSTKLYKLCWQARLPNNASTINPMPNCLLTALKIHVDDFLE